MSNGVSATINSKQGAAFLAELNRLSKSIDDLRKRVLAAMPVKYGSDLWWEKSDAKAMEDYKKGNYVTITNKKELKEFLGV